MNKDTTMDCSKSQPPVPDAQTASNPLLQAGIIYSGPTVEDLARVPAVLKTLLQWVLWRGADRVDEQTGEIKLNKIPIDPQTLTPADTTDPTTWGSFERCCAALPVALEEWEQESPAAYRGGGLGFVFTVDDPYTGIDLDNCYTPETLTVEAWAWEILNDFPSYVEITPSQTGLHILVQGSLPPRGRKKGQVEMYCDRRFFTMTGWEFKAWPQSKGFPSITDCQTALTALHARIFGTIETVHGATSPASASLEDTALLAKAQAAKNGAKFARLWGGDTSLHDDDDSVADLALCMQLAFWTQDPAQIDRLFRQSGLMREKWDERRGAQTYGDRTVQEALARQIEHYRPHENVPQCVTARPTIQITPDVAEVVDATIAALQSLPKAPVVYQRARELCIIGRNGTPPKWLRRQGDTPLIQTASAAHLWELATISAQWEKYDARSDEWRHATPPRWVPEVIQGRSAWPFPLLEGVICSPTLRPDGSVLDTPGYDPDTGLYLDCNGTTFPKLLPHPTLDDARSALGRLQEVFQDFPFAIRTPGELTNPFFSAAIAAVLTLVCRSAIHGNVPMFGVTATAAGSGKGKLVDAVALIGTGRVAPKMGQTLDESEELKRLLALALEGASVCCIDNVAHPLGNQHLDLAITSQTIHGRILGQTGMAEAPWHAVMFATGNNLSYRGDMVRRVVPIALDPQMERPEERTSFRHPQLEEWIRGERPCLVVAALTIVHAYFLAGCPDQGLTPYGSFEAWSDLIRNALVWLGEADPCEGRKDLAAQTDENYERLAALLTAWELCYPTQEGTVIPERTVNQVKQDIGEYASDNPQIPNKWDELRDVLIPFDKKFDGKTLNSLRIGTAFRDIEGRVIGQKRLKRHGEYRHNALWRIEKV
jgi:hypothetical protein